MVYSSTMPPEPALRAFLDEEVIPLLVARFLREHGAANSRHERSEAGHARRAVRGVNYFCRLATTISAGEGSAKECWPRPDRTR